MRSEQRRPRVAPFPLVALGVALSLLIGACGGPTPSPAPASPSPIAVVSASPSASPSVSPTASPTPIASPSAVIACAVTPQTVQLPSDRVTDLKVATSATADRLTFVFGNFSLNGGPPPQGKLDPAEPPYTQAGSGATIDVAGTNVIAVRFSGMSLQNDVGQETYKGPAEIKSTFPAVRHVVLYDASEGVMGWYVGYDGPGCVTLAREGNTVTVTIAHS